MNRSEKACSAAWNDFNILTAQEARNELAAQATELAAKDAEIERLKKRIEEKKS